MEPVETWPFARVDREEHRAEVVITRPDRRNALDEPTLEDLTAAVETAGSLDTRVVLLRGTGPVLRAGMDLEMMRERKGEGGVEELFPALLSATEGLSVPTVVAIEGAAVAGGFELTLPFDLRVLGRGADYGVPEVRLGTFPHGGATQRLPRLVGLSRAKRIVLTGELIEPGIARSMGLVHELAADGAVLAAARGLADRLARNAPLGLTRAKRALDLAPETELATGLEHERTLAAELDDTHDYHEGFEARVEHREPSFEGR
jgi:enoyl-CoA hydratase/carnithine racemase